MSEANLKTISEETLNTISEANLKPISANFDYAKENSNTLRAPQGTLRTLGLLLEHPCSVASGSVVTKLVKSSSTVAPSVREVQWQA